jgi:hypothetical protein
MPKSNAGFIGKAFVPTAVSKSCVFTPEYLTYNLLSGRWNYTVPLFAAAGLANGSFNEQSVVIPSGTTSIKVYGGAGGGSCGIPDSGLAGRGGGGGGAVQLSGYTLSVTPGSTLNCYIGSHGQATYIQTSGANVFVLNAGAPSSTTTGGAGGANSASPLGGFYNSHFGGAGGNGGARFGAGSAGNSGSLIGGGGGGGGYGDNSPFVNGSAGGAGAGISNTFTVATSNGQMTFISSVGAAGGGNGTVPGISILNAYGGPVSGQGYGGGGAGAGGGVKCDYLPLPDLFYCGGAGGAGSGVANPSANGGPGFLIIDFNPV